MTAVFVTSTGTEIGKTFVACGMIHHLRARGRSVEALKPVVTGYDPCLAHASDTGRLLAALGRALTPDHIDAISPFRLREPVSPDLAARRENVSIDFDALGAPEQLKVCQEVFPTYRTNSARASAFSAGGMTAKCAN